MRWPAHAARNNRDLMQLNQEITNRQLAMILRDAASDAEEMARRIGSMTGIGARTREAQLRIAASGAREISGQLWNLADKEIRAGIFDAVDLSINHAIDLDDLLGMPTATVTGLREGIQQSVGRSVEAIVSRKQYGHTLSERVWRNDRRTARRIQGLIDSGLVRGLSAREMAREVRQFVHPNTPGGASYAAMRLSRTEINNSYHTSYREKLASRPWVDAVSWELSGSHPEVDICDELAHAGPYQPKDVPNKPHPHCLCYTNPVTPDPDQFVSNLLSGQYDTWIMENT